MEMDNVPAEIREIFTDCTGDEGYDELLILLKKCEELNWTFDFYLDAEPYNLHPIKEN